HERTECLHLENVAADHRTLSARLGPAIHPHTALPIRSRAAEASTGRARPHLEPEVIETTRLGRERALTVHIVLRRLATDVAIVAVEARLKQTCLQLGGKRHVAIV